MRIAKTSSIGHFRRMDPVMVNVDKRNEFCLNRSQGNERSTEAACRNECTLPILTNHFGVCESKKRHCEKLPQNLPAHPRMSLRCRRSPD